ncbi:Nucleolar protein [Actinidia chinensis var. chinensis]|uniref:Nucleolar protein n=1 Tax=Actinidia chinensis var. chinensis TaxID=1590841 RepID=A0A2R6PAL0_ACTCC|nr:Nucleolar protein [Actinidia chinensis var. chinensis]
MASETVTNPMDFKVRELLKEVQLDYSPSFTKLVDETVSAIRETIHQIPEDLHVTEDVAPGFVRDIGADKVEFKFKKPKSIEIGGSYSMRCIAKPDVNVDLFVRMPKECFHEKDYLNYRYHAKRFLYLCIVKKYLKLSSVAQKVEWSTFQNEARKPILVVHPDMKLVESPQLLVRIIPTATSVFNVSKLNLDRNNVRALNQGGVLQATLKYNSSMLEDLFLEDNAEFVKRTFLGWKELGEALILLKVWARQRSSIYVHDCLNGFLISVIMAYLGTKSGRNRINNSMTTMQIFRVTMDFIATSKLWDNGLFFQHQGEQSTSKESRISLKSFPVVICGPFADFTLTFRMTRSGFLELRDEAALTLSCIDKCGDGGFDEVFMTRIDFPAKYDYCIRLNMKNHNEVYAMGFCLDDECWRSYEQKVLSLMHQALNDRAKTIRITWRNTLSGCNLEDGFSMFDREPLLIGISVSTLEKALRVVDIGPNAENKDEALKFRKFWGDKADLRRFKDGTIAESTVWDCKHWERYLIIRRIIDHVLVRHLSLSKENITTVVDQLDFSLLYGSEDPIAFSASLLEAFEVLSKRLRLLNDIPLRVSSVQPLDSAFRFTSVFPPRPHPLAVEKSVNLRLQKLTSSCIHPLEVMIQLEGSGNWPMDEVAIEKTKSAFLLKIGESLQNNWGMACNPTEDDVVVFTSGYAFRLKALHERGLNLLKRQIGSNQVKWVPSTDKILSIRGQHSSMINGLQGRFPIYGPVVRLAKRWVAAHFFSTSLEEEAVELLVAYLFLKPFPFYAPCSRIAGFLRFLRLLSEYDWAFSALIVDINGDLTVDDEKEINGNFTSSRKAYDENMQNTSPAVFLATSYDKASEAWTKSTPSSLELKRLVAYARSSADLLSKLILHDQPESYKWECLYRTPLSNYNAVVLLHRDKLPYPQRLLFPSELNQGRHVVRGSASKDFHPFILPGEMNGSVKDLKHKLMVDFDPLRCFVGDLEKLLPDTFKVWYDSLGGDAIGLTWEGLGSKVSKKRGREVGEGEDDFLDVLKNVGEAGKGFVRSIYFLKAPRLCN